MGWVYVNYVADVDTMTCNNTSMILQMCNRVKEKILTSNCFIL